MKEISEMIKKNGKGTYKFSNGKIYERDFRDGKKMVKEF